MIKKLKDRVMFVVPCRKPRRQDDDDDYHINVEYRIYVEYTAKHTQIHKQHDRDNVESRFSFIIDKIRA